MSLSEYASKKCVCPDLPVFSDPIRAHAGRRNGRRQFGSSFYETRHYCPSLRTICPTYRRLQDPFRRSARYRDWKKHFQTLNRGRSTEGVFPAPKSWADGAFDWAVTSTIIKTRFELPPAVTPPGVSPNRVRKSGQTWADTFNDCVWAF